MIYEIDAEQCIHYARFASHLERWQFDALYWLLFAGNILLLSFVSWWYGRTSDGVKDLPADHPRFIRLHKKCLYVSLLCSAVSVVVAVMEVYALMALQFCDGEDLMSLYWSTWAMLQFGSVIAIFGIVLHVSLVLQGHDRPPWALALGTPVLVVAGIGNLFNSLLHRKTADVIQRTRTATVGGRSRSGSRSGSRIRDLPMSQAPTIRPESLESVEGTNLDSMHNAVLVGTALDGGVILQFSHAFPALETQLEESRGRLISRAADGQVLVSFGRDNVEILEQTEGVPPAGGCGASLAPRGGSGGGCNRSVSGSLSRHRHKGSLANSSFLLELPAMSTLELDMPTDGSITAAGWLSRSGSVAPAVEADVDADSDVGRGRDTYGPRDSSNTVINDEKPPQITIQEPPNPPR